MQDSNAALLDAAMIHVPFDGWSDATLRASAADIGMDMAEARAIFPRGGVDMALAYHKRGDALMLHRLETENLSSLRFRDRIARAVRLRIEASEDRELVRRGAALFALPHHAAEGAAAIWQTCDRIWTALGDEARDYNWYTKRATLSGVYSATVLFWLGDGSINSAETWKFLDRRIDGVMQFERVKSGIEKNPLGRVLTALPRAALSFVKAPRKSGLDGARDDLPGSLNRRPPPA